MLQKYPITSLIIACCVAVACYYVIHHFTQPTIKIGILHSLTGPMAEYEKTAFDATILSVEEINADGGIFGRKLEPIIIDGKSDVNVFTQGAEQLILRDKVAVIFGCWRTTDRKAVKILVEKYNSLLFYPVQHEGLEDSPNISYTSTIPNQQAIPATTWCIQNLGKKIFIIGSDELFSRANNEIIKDTIATFDGVVSGEEYIKTNNNDFDPIIQKIITTQPEVILNTINGPENLPFFKALRAAGISAEKIPTMSLCIDEPELQKYGAEYMVGDYSCWSHFQSIERIENKIFVARIKKRFGQEYVVSDAMEAAYFGVYLWKQAVVKAQSLELEKVIPALRNQAFNAPEGIIYIDDPSLHSWSVVSVGKIRSDKQFTILWNSNKAMRPLPYPFFRKQAEWDELLIKWYKQWGNQWPND